MESSGKNKLRPALIYCFNFPFFIVMGRSGCLLIFTLQRKINIILYFRAFNIAEIVSQLPLFLFSTPKTRNIKRMVILATILFCISVILLELTSMFLRHYSAHIAGSEVYFFHLILLNQVHLSH